MKDMANDRILIFKQLRSGLLYFFALWMRILAATIEIKVEIIRILNRSIDHDTHEIIIFEVDNCFTECIYFK